MATALHAEEEIDLEKKEEPFVSASAYDEDSTSSQGKTAVASRTGGLWNLTHKLAQYGVEEQGIERFDENQRNHKQVYTLFTMWFTTNCTISTMSLGTLGASIWYLGFKDAFLTILFFNLIGCIPAAIMSVLGCRTGMRQLAMSRFFFGYYTNSIPIVLNCLACIGWSCVNAIVGGLALSAVNYDSSLPTLPVSAAIVIIAMGTLVVSFMGYRVVHLYEKYSWVPPFICFIIFAVEVGKHGATAQEWGGSGEIEAASVLSFGATIIGFAIGWVSLAADYSCQLPENTSGVKIFAYTYAGIAVPCILLETLGAAAMTTFKSSPFIAEAYDSLGLGGLLAATLIEPLGGFGRFLLIILGLSIIGNNIPNIYSFALTAQALHPVIQRNVPRPILTIFATAVYIALAIPGSTSFYHAFENLLLLLAYWLSIYATIAFIEHFGFKRGRFSNWNFDALHQPDKLPLGLASLISLCIGFAGAMLGCSTTFWVGPVGKSFGLQPFGGDIGFEMAIGFTAISYPALRYFERKYKR